MNRVRLALFNQNTAAFKAWKKKKMQGKSQEGLFYGVSSKPGGDPGQNIPCL